MKLLSFEPRFDIYAAGVSLADGVRVGCPVRPGVASRHRQASCGDYPHCCALLLDLVIPWGDAFSCLYSWAQQTRIFNNILLPRLLL